MKDTQKQIVIDQLNAYGEVTRNWCLSQYISRLSAIIQDLEVDGWRFNPDFRKLERGKDYVYKVVKKPELKLF